MALLCQPTPTLVPAPPSVERLDWCPPGSPLSPATQHRSVHMKTRLLLPLLLLPIIAAAQTYTYSTLVSFPAQQGPLSPTTQLIIDGAGNLYATSQAGGIYAPPFDRARLFTEWPPAA